MSMSWSQIADYLYGNRVAIGSAAMLALTAAIKTSPIPSSTAGRWLYDFSHQVFNITNTRLTTATIPTAPDSKEAAVLPPKS